MKRGHKIYPFIWFFILSLNLLLGQQSSSYLTQKLMVESDLRSRIASALSKIIDDQKYVIDVNVIAGNPFWIQPFVDTALNRIIPSI